MKKSQLHVIQSNELICARYKLNLAGQRVLLAVLSQIRLSDTGDGNIYKIRLKDLMDILGQKNNHTFFFKTAKSLMSKPLIIMKESGKPLMANWFASVDYSDTVEGEIEIEISQKLKPYLFNIKEKFTDTLYFDSVKLKSIYSIRFFFLLKRQAGLSIFVQRYKISELKAMFEIENKFKLYGNFKKKVLNVAYKELKGIFPFEYKEEKCGKKVFAIDIILPESAVKRKKQIGDDVIPPWEER